MKQYELNGETVYVYDQKDFLATISLVSRGHTDLIDKDGYYHVGNVRFRGCNNKGEILIIDDNLNITSILREGMKYVEFGFGRGFPIYDDALEVLLANAEEIDDAISICRMIDIEKNWKQIGVVVEKSAIGDGELLNLRAYDKNEKMVSEVVLGYFHRKKVDLVAECDKHSSDGEFVNK